jgi:hypothetical protein
MRNYTHSLIALLLLGAAAAFAGKPSRFEAYPAEAKRFSTQVKERQTKDRQEVEAWSKIYGVPIREKRGNQTVQLMAIRNGVPLYYTTLNKYAGISTAANQVRNTAPYNLNGEGITIGVWDAGSARTSHNEFGSRVTFKGSDSTSTGIDDHATHVTGTIAASGVDADAIGMAPSITVHSYGWDYDLSEMSGAAASAANQSGKIYLSNHSYGIDSTAYFGQYMWEVDTLDNLVHGKRYYLPFIAAGNEQQYSSSGYDTISYYGVAKNVMTVGAVKDAVSGSTRSLAGATMPYFSSWGPVDDGRIKPDIVANGWELYSTDSSSDSTYIQTGWSGTSMACPNASGSAALLVEYYKELFSSAMWASTLKGLIIHTADDLGNDGPDYKFGWGLMDTKAAADLLADYADSNSSRLNEAELTPSDPSHSYTVRVGGDEPVRVTLCWTDPAASENYDELPDLINDLNLRVVGPSGTTTYPYVLDKANPGNVATRGVNDVDNVEQVYIESPSTGLYTIIVDYAGSLQDAEQEYSLLMSGISSDSDGDDIPDYWEQQYFASSTGAVTTADADNDGSDNLTEYIAGTIPNDATSVFEVTSYSMDEESGVPFTLNWTSVEGRIYNVMWSDNLQYEPFADNDISGDLPYPANSYTDTNETRTGQSQFYRLGVRLSE